MSQAAILCVDDETLVLETLEIEFHKAFNDTYRYEFAESAEEALEIIDELHEEDINIFDHFYLSIPCAYARHERHLWKH